MAVEQECARIVKTPDILGGKPRIADRRISVRFIHESVEGRGLAPQTVADRHDLGVADVYRALAYYHEHPGEMARFEKQRNERNAHIDEIALGPEETQTN